MSRLDMNCFIYQLKLQQNWQISHVTQVSVMAVTEAVCEVSVSKPAPVLRSGDFICENANAR